MAIYQDNRAFVTRLRWMGLVFALLFSVLGLKLWMLTVLEYDRYQELAERNHIRTIPLIAPRGIIYDRNGRVLADSVSSFNLLLFRDEAVDLDRTESFLVGGLSLEREALRERLRTAETYAVYQPLVVKENLSMEEIAYLMAHQAEHPELRIFEQPRRRYQYGKLAGHTLGYVGEVSSSELKSPGFSNYRPGDIIGKYGIERVQDEGLKGVDGYRRVLVNSLGKTLEEIERILPQEGEALHLSLDLDLQQAAEQGLGDSPGAVVALDPRSGEILALASTPSFDPNLFATRMSSTEWKGLIENPDNPFQNRAIQNAFSPGSIFKLVIAVAGLQEGVINESTTTFCKGGATHYGHYFRCWKAGGHGFMNLHAAIQQSCNVYFYQLGKQLGIETIGRYSELLGLGRPSGIDLLGEIAGLVPSEEWKEETFGEPWYAGETISVSIGQGPLNVTPLQLARAVGLIAIGAMPEPHLIRSKRTPEIIPASLTSDLINLPHLLQDNLRVIREAMWSVVNDWGTGRGARVENFSVCGKTGTVQTISNSARAKLNDEDRKRFEPNAWFVGFAPLEAPEIVVSVIVQRGGSGSAAAAPIAGQVFQTYYDRYTKEEQPGQELALKESLFSQRELQP